jgi:hypothetical protein
LVQAAAGTTVRAGVPLGEIREILGHKSLAMVLRYSRHCSANVSAQAGKRLEGVPRREDAGKTMGGASGRLVGEFRDDRAWPDQAWPRGRGA